MFLHGRFARSRKWRTCYMGEAKEDLDNELWCRALLIHQPFCCFTYITTHSPTLLSLYLCHSSFSNPSVASPTSQLILQLFFCFSYVTGSSLTSPGELPMLFLTIFPAHLAFNRTRDCPNHNRGPKYWIFSCIYDILNISADTQTPHWNGHVLYVVHQ